MRGCATFVAALLLAAGAARGEGAANESRDLGRSAQQRFATGELVAVTALRRRALDAARAEFGAGSAPAAAAQAALAHVYVDRQRYLDAEPLLVGARIDLDTAGATARLAPVLSDLARVALARGEPQRAEALARQAIAAERRQGAPAGDDRRRVLAAALAAQRRWSAAAAILEPMAARAAGRAEAATAPDLAQLAGLYLRQDRYADALPLIERALVIDQRRLAPDHPLLAADWYDLGVAYLGLKRLGLAERAMRTAIDRLDRGGERATPRAANVELGLARALHEQGYRDQARAWFDDAQRILDDGEREERRRERQT